MEFRSQTLPNGLEIVAECDPEAHTSALAFFVKTGARDETDAVSGVSHFLEHMVFKGTPTRSSDDVNREFDEMGAEHNAYTSEEQTVYHAVMLPEFTDRVVALWSDVLRPSLREEDFHTEKKVIIEEICMYADQPPFGADDRLRAAYFGAHPLGRSVLGTAQSVGDLRVEDMRTYFERRYSPTNIALVAAGRVAFDELVAAAERACGHWQPFAAPRERMRAAPQPGFECVVRETATQEYIMQFSQAPSAVDDDRYAAKLLSAIVGDDSGSRLFWEMVDPGLAENASLGFYPYQDAGVLYTFVSCAPDEAQANLERVADVFRRVEAEGITSQELAQAKSKINSRIVLSSERPRGRLWYVGGDWIYRREYRTVRELLEAYDRVTVDDVHAVLARYPLSKHTAIAIGPEAHLQAPA